MAEATTVDEIAIPVLGVIGIDEPVRVARRRMEAEERRSLLVVDGDRLVGTIQWRHIMSESDVPADAPVRDYMDTEVPVLHRGMSLAEARATLGGDVDVDVLPVVDEDGRVVGEVPRDTVAHVAVAGESVDAEAVPSAPIAIRPGMTVRGASGKKLGEVEDVEVDATSGSPRNIMVKYGLLGRKRKRLPAETVNNVDAADGIVTLVIAQQEFDHLADVDSTD